MVQKQLIGFVIVAVIVLITGWFVFTAPSTPQVPAMLVSTTSSSVSYIPPRPAAPTPVSPVPGAATSYVQLFTESGNHECDYEQVTATGRNSNVIYIADGKMRGEFRSTVNGNTTGTLMIYSNGYLYTWNEGMTTGTKTSISKLSQLPSIIPSDLAGGSILGTNTESVGWFCHSWNKDNSMLELPSYVSFTTL